MHRYGLDFWASVSVFFSWLDYIHFSWRISHERLKVVPETALIVAFL